MPRQRRNTSAGLQGSPQTWIDSEFCFCAHEIIVIPPLTSCQWRITVIVMTNDNDLRNLLQRSLRQLQELERLAFTLSAVDVQARLITAKNAVKAALEVERMRVS